MPHDSDRHGGMTWEHSGRSKVLLIPALYALVAFSILWQISTATRALAGYLDAAKGRTNVTAAPTGSEGSSPGPKGHEPATPNPEEIRRGPIDVVSAGSTQSSEGNQKNLEKGQKFPDWVQRVFEALNHPLMALILLLVGFTAAFVEANTPGLGVPGFVALISFVLFFWSTFLGGTSTWLEAVLFVTGIICLIIEAVLIPGFGIFGIGGWLMIILALVLAQAHEQWPPTPETWEKILTAGVLVAVAMTGGILLAAGLVAAIGRWGAGGLVLVPPGQSQAEAAPLLRPEAPVSVGDIGVAITPLRLSGKARFPAGVVDVLSRDLPVEPGQKVRITKIRGNLVEVQIAEDSLGAESRPSEMDPRDGRCVNA
ncbi:MAG: hypothetical protein NZ899_10970 [Thermoguttaceae bacterium]|nr:hypothetical protein [Thermoguttaceae bacterium]MDW8079154.1 hypothetical protein [Thermoguttaceae bacterium]